MKSYALALIATSAMGASRTRPHHHEGIQGPHDFDTNGDGQLNRDEVEAYAESIGKGHMVDIIFNRSAAIPTDKAEEILNSYNYDKAYSIVREKYPNLTDTFEDIWVNADALGNQDYECTVGEFFTYLHTDPVMGHLIDVDGLRNWAGGTQWYHTDPVQAAGFCMLALKYAFIDGYDMNNRSTWIMTEDTAKRFEGSVLVTDETFKALEDQYISQVPIDKYDKWFKHIFTESNYVHEPDLLPDARKWLAQVDKATGDDGYITARDMFNFVSENNEPEFLSQLSDAVDAGQTYFGWDDCGIEFGYNMADILMGAYIGADRDPSEAFTDRATRLLKTLNIVDVDPADARISSAEELETFLVTSFLYKEL